MMKQFSILTRLWHNIYHQCVVIYCYISCTYLSENQMSVLWWTHSLIGIAVWPLADGHNLNLSTDWMFNFDKRHAKSSHFRDSRDIFPLSLQVLLDEPHITRQPINLKYFQLTMFSPKIVASARKGLAYIKAWSKNEIDQKTCRKCCSEYSIIFFRFRLTYIQ